MGAKWQLKLASFCISAVLKARTEESSMLHCNTQPQVDQGTDYIQQDV